MNKTTETIGNATGETGWRKTFPKKWTPPAQPCGAWGRKMKPDVQTQALQAFGADRQVDKCIEELGELATVLVKYRHGEATAAQVIDELADVDVTTGTLWLLFDRKAIEARIAVKLERLSRLVADQVRAKVQENPFRELVREPRAGETKCGDCMWWGAQGQRNTVGVCMHKDRASRDRGYMAAADCSLSAPKPEPSPVKPQPVPGKTLCVDCPHWHPVMNHPSEYGVCHHPARPWDTAERRAKHGPYLAATNREEACLLPGPSPVKPVLRWEAGRGDELVLYDGASRLGSVSRSPYWAYQWTATAAGCDRSTHASKETAMHIVCMELGIVACTVPIWPVSP